MKCSKCGKEGLSPSDFHVDRRTKSGRRADCVECHREASRVHRWAYYQLNRKRILAKRKKAK